MTDERNPNGSSDVFSERAAKYTWDPFAAALRDSPYVIVESLTPDMSFPDVHRLMLRLQQRKLKAEERAAFREVRDLTARLVWDLQTLGTASSVAQDQWLALSALLGAGQREQALRQWLAETEDPVVGASALHICAVLTGNEIAQQLQQGQPARDDQLQRCVAFWAALLRKREWLIEFACHRCRIWGRAAPDRGDQTQFLDRAEKTLADRILAAAGEIEPRRSQWNTAWVRERTVIEAVERAFGGQPRPAWAQGFGPLGLEILGRRKEAQSWVREESRAYRGGIPLCAVRGGEARVDPRDKLATAEAATALALLFSGLGEAACEVWNGRPRAALALLYARPHEVTRTGEPPEADAWFGQGQGATVRFQRAVDELKAESLLLQFQEELTRPEIPPDQTDRTLERLLQLADFTRQPSVLIERVEDLVVGRLSACVESKRLPQPAEVERLIEVSRAARKVLLERRAGERCGSALARLLRRRAVGRWNRHGQKLPKANVQHNVLRDLIEATNLAPHNTDLTANLCRVVVQMNFGGEAEHRSRLETALSYIDRCQENGATSPELDEARLGILDQLDPVRALDEARRSLREVTQGGRSEAKW